MAEYLASELCEDVRQLKSGLAGVITKASLLGSPLNVELATSVIQNMVQKPKEITINLIKRLVCKRRFIV